MNLEKRVMMDEYSNDRIYGFPFIKNAILKPKANINGNTYISVKNNIEIFLFLFFGIHFMSAIINIPIMGAMSPYAAMGLVVVFICLFLFVFWIPVFLVNIQVLNFLNKKYSGTARSRQKIWSDHSTILIRYYLLYSIGSWLFAYSETTYVSLAGQLIILAAIILYISHSIYLVIHYAKDGSDKTYRILLKYALMGIVMIAMASIPVLLTGDFSELFVEQFLVKLWLILVDLGVV